MGVAVAVGMGVAVGGSSVVMIDVLVGVGWALLAGAQPTKIAKIRIPDTK